MTKARLGSCLALIFLAAGLGGCGVDEEEANALGQSQDELVTSPGGVKLPGHPGARLGDVRQGNACYYDSDCAVSSGYVVGCYTSTDVRIGEDGYWVSSEDDTVYNYCWPRNGADPVTGAPAGMYSEQACADPRADSCYHRNGGGTGHMVSPYLDRLLPCSQRVLMSGTCQKSLLIVF